MDDADFEWLSQWKWHVASGGYARRWMYDPVRGKKWNMGMHDLVMQTPAGYEVDHLNGDPADNRRENLEVGTHSQNMYNNTFNRQDFGRWLTDRMAGRVLGLSSDEVLCLRHVGVIPWMSFGGACFIWVEDLTVEVIAWIMKQVPIMREEGIWRYKNARQWNSSRRYGLDEELVLRYPAPRQEEPDATDPVFQSPRRV